MAFIIGKKVSEMRAIVFAQRQRAGKRTCTDYSENSKLIMQNRHLSELALASTSLDDQTDIVCRVRIHHLDVKKLPHMTTTPVSSSRPRSRSSIQTNLDTQTI